MAKKVRCHACVMGPDQCFDCQNRQRDIDLQERIEAEKPKTKPAGRPFPQTRFHCGTCGESYLPGESCACTTRGE